MPHVADNAGERDGESAPAIFQLGYVALSRRSCVARGARSPRSWSVRGDKIRQLYAHVAGCDLPTFTDRNAVPVANKVKDLHVRRCARFRATR